MFCYFVILFCLLHFLFQHDLVSVSELLTSYIYIYIYIYGESAIIPHTALLSHSKLRQGKFLNRNSPTLTLFFMHILKHRIRNLYWKPHIKNKIKKDLLICKTISSLEVVFDLSEKLLMQIMGDGNAFYE